MLQKIELLVHTSAPSSRLDDDEYKAQAKSYLSFDGLRVDYQVDGRSQSVLAVDEDVDDRARGLAEHTLSGQTKFLDDTQLAISGLESQLFTSSLAAMVATPTPIRPRANESRSRVPPSSSGSNGPGSNGPPNGTLHIRERNSDLSTHLKRRREETGPETFHLDGADGTISTEASFSSYLKSPELHRKGKRQRLDPDGNHAQRDHRGQLSSLADPMKRLDASQSKEVSTVGRAQPSAQGLQSSAPQQEASSELPTSYSLSDITSESSRARQRLSQRSISDPGPMTNPMLAASPGHAADDREGGNQSRREAMKPSPVEAITHANHHGSNLVDQLISATENVDSTAVMHPIVNRSVCGQVDGHDEPVAREKLPKYTQTIRSADQRFSSLPVSIHPPPPSVGLVPFSTHVSPSLLFLAENSEVSKVYKPLEITRELRPMERGHWSLDPSSWPAQAQVDFWDFLVTTVGGGDAGWGVWCTRGDEQSRPLLSHADGPSASKTAASRSSLLDLGRIRVFCWGEVVRHIYLMLYVASKSRVRKLGLRWVDAAGRVVVRMRDR